MLALNWVKMALKMGSDTIFAATPIGPRRSSHKIGEGIIVSDPVSAPFLPCDIRFRFNRSAGQGGVIIVSDPVSIVSDPVSCDPVSH